MLAPGALAAAGVLTGVAIGCADPVLAAPGWRAALLAGGAASWGLAVAAHRRARTASVIAAVIFGFGLLGVGLGAAAARDATTASLRAWYETQLMPGGRWRHPLVLQGHLREDGIATGYGALLQLAVEEVTTGTERLPLRGGVRLGVSGVEVGSRLEQWRAGRVVRVTAVLRRPARYLNPGGGSQDERQALQGTVLQGTVKSALLVEVVARGHGLAEAAAAVRAHVREAVGRAVGGFSARSAGITTAVLIGDRAGLDVEVERRLQESGTYHVIAISGGNTAILAGLLLLVLRGAGAPPRAAAPIASGEATRMPVAVTASTLSGGVRWSAARADNMRTAAPVARSTDASPPTRYA